MATTPRGFVPTKEGDYLDWAHVIVNQTDANKVEWKLDAPLVALVKGEYHKARAAWEANRDPALKNHATAVLKDEVFANLKNDVRMLVNSLEGSRAVPDSALAEMHLRPRHPGSHQPLPVPANAPTLEAVPGLHHELNIYVADLQHGHPTEYLTEGKYAGFLIEWRFEESEQTNTVTSSRLHYTLRFPEEAQGKFVLLKVAWINGRYEAGPWSETQREVVT